MGEWEAAKGSDWQSGRDDWRSTTRGPASGSNTRPGLDRAREARQDEIIRDADGTVCIDRKNRVITPPGDLQKLLGRNAKARALFDTLSFTNQREYVGWIIEAKRPETRAARLSKTVDLLSKGKKNPIRQVTADR